MKKVTNFIKLVWMITYGEPFHFEFISNEKGEPVGPELQVKHLTLHDFESWACRCRLTEEILLTGQKDINAIKITGFKRINDVQGVTIFQPYKV